MDQKEIMRQMIQLNKTAFENSFNALKIVQEQNMKMLHTFLEQAAWLPEDSKNAVSEWSDTYVKGCDNFKDMVDDYYGKIEGFFTSK